MTWKAKLVTMTTGDSETARSDQLKDDSFDHISSLDWPLNHGFGLDSVNFRWTTHI